MRQFDSPSWLIANGVVCIKAAYSDLPQEIRDRSFDWKSEFQQVFAQGGFDCVIGNPPYIRQERLSSLQALSPENL